MVNNAFAGQANPPTEDALASELGAAKPAWDALLKGLSEQLGLAVQDWNSYSRKAGWSLRVKMSDRNIVYLSPGHGVFMASFALGDKAIRAARESKLPKHVIDT